MLIRFFFVCTFFLLTYHDARAAETSEDIQDLEQTYDRLFQSMLRDPANLDIMFRYAAVATKLENFEAAISALERMLLINPNLPRVKLELGVLYFRLGAFPIARRYFENAVSGEKVPPEVKEKVETFLARIEDAEDPHTLVAWLRTGLRYQTNANAGPIDERVKALGFDAILGDESLPESDWNLFGEVRFRHTYDISEDGRTNWESNLLAHYSKQIDLDELDLGYLEVTTGPSLVLADFEDGNLRARPFALGNLITLDDRKHFATAGGGIEFIKPFGSQALLGGSYVFRHKKFFNSEAEPNNDDFTGNEHTFRLSGRYLPEAWLSLGVHGQLSLEDAKAEFNASDEWLVGGIISVQYDAPFGITNFPWSNSLVGEYVETNFATPDPSVDPMLERLDEEWRASLSTTIGIEEDLSANLLVRFVDNDSNLPNFRFENWSFQFSVTKRF